MATVEIEDHTEEVKEAAAQAIARALRLSASWLRWSYINELYRRRRK